MMMITKLYNHLNETLVEILIALCLVTAFVFFLAIEYTRNNHVQKKQDYDFASFVSSAFFFQFLRGLGCLGHF